MKSLLRAVATTALLAGLSLAPALAQETIARMQVTGTVMTSEGGEFVPAGDGTALQVGERVMVAENSSATVTYSDGRVEKLTKPGVYTISRLDRGAAIVGNAAIDGSDKLMMGIAAAVWTAGLASSMLDDDEDLVGAPPISR